MDTVLFVLAGLVALAVVFVAAMFVSVKWGKGAFAARVGTLLARTPLVKLLARKATERLAAGDLDVENLRGILDSQPELVDEMARQQGVDPSQARAALKQFSSMDERSQDRVLAQAQAGLDAGKSPEEVAASIKMSPGRSSQRNAQAAKKKTANRQKRKAAKKQRRR